MHDLFGAMLDRSFVENIQLIRHHGLLWGVRSLERKLFKLISWYLNAEYDKKHNVTTTAGVCPPDSDITSSNRIHGIGYVLTSAKAFRTIIADLPTDLHEYSFVDFGCGKGKTLFLASNYNFKEIIGVEYSQCLSDVAKRNIQSYRSKKQQCKDLRCVHSDAVNFAIPENPCVVYFFAPFRKVILMKVIDNVITVHRRSEKTIFICYCDEVDTGVGQKHMLEAIEVFEQYDFACKIDVTQVTVDLGAQPNLEFVIYQVGSGRQ